MSTEPNRTIHPVKMDAHYSEFGLTKREYFAAMAMQGILARPDTYGHKSRQDFLTSHTSIAVELADQLIIELNK